ncbi:MAG: AAA family ATPase [Euryarchaeota archaeon]|nr:AAA family ATPase [Euryarchaeota archaeon]
MIDRNERALVINVTDLGDYVDKNCCDRNMKLRLILRKDSKALDQMFPYRQTIGGTLDPVLIMSGELRENEVEELLSRRMQCINPSKEVNNDNKDEINWTEALSAFQTLSEGEECFAREVKISLQIGNFYVTSKMDFLILTWNDDLPILRIVECKASRKDKTYHRIQLAAYKLIVDEQLQKSPLVISNKIYENIILEAAVVRIDGDNCCIQDPLDIPPLDLCEEIDDVIHLLAPNGPVEIIDATPLDDLSYCLDEKCDSCAYDTICMPESEKAARLELLGLDPVTTQAIQKEGVEDILALSELDPSSSKASSMRNSPTFNIDLNDLVKRAKARRSTMPYKRDSDYEVIDLRRHGVSTLPAHQNREGLRTIRIYLSVEYDHIEDRLIGLSAHLTDSDQNISTIKEDGVPFPAPVEGAEGAEKLVNCKYIIRIIENKWSGDIDKDDELEGEMIQSFITGLSKAMMAIANGDDFRPVHFYVWSPREITLLVESCSRIGRSSLRSLTELLGCREKCQGDLEQLIYTSISDEISKSKALGFTSFSLPLAASVRWYGKKFHWHRVVEENSVDLTYAFKRDLFDNRSYLYIDENGKWVPRRKHSLDTQRRYMEVRARFRSGIPMPYWYAMWGVLPDKGEWEDNVLRRALVDYRRGGTPSLIKTFLMAKCEALRWLEEKFNVKNQGLEKPIVPIYDLKNIESHFNNRYDLVTACQDFMRLDHHYSKREWLTDLSRSPAARVADGVCIPLRNVRFRIEGRRTLFSADIDLDRFGIESKSFLSMCGLDLGMMRISPYGGDIEYGPTAYQTLQEGITVTVTEFDAYKNIFKGEVIPYSNRSSGSGYILRSLPPESKSIPFALAGESKSAYVRDRVDRWLDANRNAPLIAWFDTESPSIPIWEPSSAKRKDEYRQLLKNVRLRQSSLDDVQIEACLEGLESTIQLILGPPGTGKTNTASAAILLRLIARPGHKLFLLSATTHTAVDELCGRIRQIIPEFNMAAKEAGVDVASASVLRIKREPLKPYEISSDDISIINDKLMDGNVIVCGTVNDLLRLGDIFERYGWPRGTSRADGLVIDEASMMIFPEFLALSTLIAEDGEILLAGDHMQLSPITSHNWDKETREQIVRMCPHNSAYEAMRRLIELSPEGAIRQSALSITYRLTPELTNLISPVYNKEGIILTSNKESVQKDGMIRSFSDLWKLPGVYLVIHDESLSRKSNSFEVQLIKDIIMSREVSEDSVDPEHISIITPHRAQRGLLKEELGAIEANIRMIDTVERIQGGECENIIVSGTQSDISTIGNNAEFILDLNRTNVIFSRAQERLIVVCSRNLLNSMPADFEHYSSSILWKKLRSTCDRIMLRLDKYEHGVEVRVPSEYWMRS